MCVPAGNPLEAQLPVGVAIGEALALRPDAGVDDADDDAVACAGGVLAAGRPAELRPEPTRIGEAEERGSRRVSCVTVSSGVTAITSACFWSSSACSPSASRRCRCRCRCRCSRRASGRRRPREGRVLGALEVADVLGDDGRERIDLRALRRLRRLVARDVAVIGDHGALAHLNDVGALVLRTDGRAACDGEERDARCDRRQGRPNAGDVRPRRPCFKRRSSA